MSDDAPLTMTPLGSCPVCAAPRGRQAGNEEGTIQQCTDCESRWERAGGVAVTTFELTACPPSPDRVGEVKPKHEWKRADASESELDTAAREASTNLVAGLVVFCLGLLLSVTVIGAVIGVPLMLVGASTMGYGGAKGASVGLRRFLRTMPAFAPGMDPEQSVWSLRNGPLLFVYYVTAVFSVPYLLYRHRRAGSIEDA